jgi:hypothetical protein
VTVYAIVTEQQAELLRVGKPCSSGIERRIANVWFPAVIVSADAGDAGAGCCALPLSWDDNLLAWHREYSSFVHGRMIAPVPVILGTMVRTGPQPAEAAC